ncbi:hypothetical protein [Sporomusa sp. KB1]|jgi:hypothetical protein|uniref:hypothetical protein n=1 Tax=Sporomusa sp. KB1 TaxID=943346 RepID=UPI0011A9C352|nr:hypothetical protein [Sporomusa sp. KB1]TWH47962.1 hypothetical protein Salpa_4089 [Sporomusa sp. KB1]
MRSFDEIIAAGVIRHPDEAECLFYGNHVPNQENGAFFMGNLLIMATTEHENGIIIEHVSASLPYGKLDSQDIRDIKEIFWLPHEIKDVVRLHIPSKIVHLQRKRKVRVA